MTMLNELLSIKSFRENKAELEVHMQRGVLERATARRDDSQRQLDDYRDWSERRERAMFQDLCSRTVLLKEIQEVQVDVSDMRVQEQGYARRHLSAEEERTREHDQLEMFKSAHADATRVRQKYVELVQVESDEIVRETERKADLDMEEVAEFPRDRLDWGQDEESA